MSLNEYLTLVTIENLTQTINISTLATDINPSRSVWKSMPTKAKRTVTLSVTTNFIYELDANTAWTSVRGTHQHQGVLYDRKQHRVHRQSPYWAPPQITRRSAYWPRLNLLADNKDSEKYLKTG